ncbi:hypothetical protein Tco_0103271 [Tanacetum coccineum]
MITGPVNSNNQILEPMSKMTEANKRQYVADVKVINYLLQAIPNDIYNSVDTCQDAKKMWERIRRLMYGSEVGNQVRHSRLMDEFDKLAAKEGESLKSLYESLTTLVNVMDHNDARPIKLYDTLLEFEPYVQESKAKRAAKNHDPLALIAHSNAYSSQSYEIRDAQEDKLTTVMILLAQEITQKFSTTTNNRLHTSSNTKNQAVIHDGRVDIQTKNVGYGGNGNKNVGRQNRNQAANAGNGLVQQNDDRNQIVQRVPQTEEQILLAMKDEARGNLNDETLKELTDAVIMMVRIQPADDKAKTEPKYDAEAINEVNALQIDLINSMISKGVHEHTNHGKLKTVINTSDDDQIDYNIIFDDPYVENNSGTTEHDSNAHDPYCDIKSLTYNVQREAENQQRLNNELQKQKNVATK